MDIPGMPDADVLDRADDEAEKLLEDLKEKVQTQVEDAGTLRKTLTVTVPEEVITQQMERNFDELRTDALVPGFRKGRAPLKLVQKRFGADVRDSLKTTILGQSFLAATENEKLEVLGDPLFSIETDAGVKLMELDEALEHFKLPETGDFTYRCEIETKPDFELPELKGIEIKAPRVEITDERVDEYVNRQRKLRGRLEPVSDAGAEKDDVLVADVKLTVEGSLIKSEENAEVGVRPLRFDGVPLMELDQALAGAKPGDLRSAECEIPDDFERADLRGKKGVFEFNIHEVKRLQPIPLEKLVELSGFESEQELREAVRDDMEAERDRLIERAKKEQILDFLLEKCALDLPEKLSSRQTERAVLRKVVELQQGGVPPHEIDARIDALRTSAREEVARSLKLEFILEKVAAELDVDVTDEEVNTEIARIARLYNQRFDRVRDNLARRGVLSQLAEQIRQDKCVHLLLADAKMVETTAEEKKKPRTKAKKTAKKATAKKKTGKASGAG